MAKIIHLADLHIGTKLDFLPQNKQETYQNTVFSELEAVVFRANNEKCDALLISGDLFDTPDISGEIVSRTFSVLAKVLCPVLISPGNHDYYYPQSPYTRFAIPVNIHVFDNRQLSAFPLEDGETVIYGAAFQDMSAQIPLVADLDRKKVNICCVHGDIGGDSGYNPVSVEQLTQSGFDYIALGHNHTFDGIKVVNSTVFACTGAFCATNKTEIGEKGYLFGEITKEKPSLKFIKTDVPTISRIDIDISDISNDNQLVELASNLIGKNTENICAFATVFGKKQNNLNFKALKNILDERFFYCIFADETLVSTDIWEKIDEDGLVGEALRVFKNDYDKADSAEREKISRAVKFTLEALEV